VPDANVDTLRQGYAALNRGDLSSVLSLIDDDIVWEEGERSLGAGEHHGRDSFADFLRSWLEAFDGFQIDLADVLERGNHIVAVGHQSGRGRASELPVAVDVVHLWTLRDGRAVGFHSYRTPADALAAIGLA
jgi:uncharacterized protein